MGVEANGGGGEEGGRERSVYGQGQWNVQVGFVDDKHLSWRTLSDSYILTLVLSRPHPFLYAF